MTSVNSGSSETAEREKKAIECKEFEFREIKFRFPRRFPFQIFSVSLSISTSLPIKDNIIPFLYPNLTLSRDSLAPFQSRIPSGVSTNAKVKGDDNDERQVLYLFQSKSKMRFPYFFYIRPQLDERMVRSFGLACEIMKLNSQHITEKVIMCSLPL